MAPITNVTVCTGFVPPYMGSIHDVLPGFPGQDDYHPFYPGCVPILISGVMHFFGIGLHSDSVYAHTVVPYFLKCNCHLDSL